MDLLHVDDLQGTDLEEELLVSIHGNYADLGYSDLKMSYWVYFHHQSHQSMQVGGCSDETPYHQNPDSTV